MTDEKIVELYWERSDEAIKETDKQYGRYFHYIAKEILQDQEDAKEIQFDVRRSKQFGFLYGFD